MCLQQPSYDWISHTTYTIKTIKKHIGQVLELLDDNVADLPEGFYLNRMNWCKHCYEINEMEKKRDMPMARGLVEVMRTPAKNAVSHAKKLLIAQNLAYIESTHGDRFTSLQEVAHLITDTAKMVKWERSFGDDKPTDEEAVAFIKKNKIYTHGKCAEAVNQLCAEAAAGDITMPQLARGIANL